MLNKYKIKTNPNQKNIRINLSSNNSFLGFQEEIKSYTEIATVDLINYTEDIELRKFNYSTGNPYINNINLKFNFEIQPFTADDINEKKLSMLNSFFIIELYDSFNESNNVKLSTNYFTKNFNFSNLYQIDKNNKNQFFNIYIPEFYLNNQSGNTFNLFLKFLFYNSTNGKTSVFYNQYVDNDTEEYTYFKITINPLDKTWCFTQNIALLNINQIPENNSSYINKINNNIDNFNQLKQTYPSGDTFSYISKNYINLD